MKKIISSLLIAVSLLSVASPAMAQGMPPRPPAPPGPPKPPPPPPPPPGPPPAPRRHNDVGRDIAIGVLGAVAGAIVAGAVNSNNNPPPPPPGQSMRPGEPWSPEWYRYCSQKYRSFDPQTGTFVTYGGERKFCVMR